MQSVRLDDGLQRGRHCVHLARLVRLLAVLEQDLLALLADRGRDQRGHPAAKVGRVARALRLDVRRERVAHARSEQPGRRAGDDGGVDDDEGGVLLEEGVLVELAVWAIEDGVGGTWCVGGGRGGHDGTLNSQAIGDGLRGHS